MVYQFKLDKWDFTDGPSILAAFGSHNDQDVDELHIILKDLLRKSPVNIDRLGITSAYDEMIERASKWKYSFMHILTHVLLLAELFVWIEWMNEWMNESVQYKYYIFLFHLLNAVICTFYLILISSRCVLRCR